jgi:hypothetical protein
MTQRTAWTIKHASDNKLDGYRESFEGVFRVGEERPPRHMAGHTTALFVTRQEARDYLAKHYRYLRKRPDLQAEPHGWRIPQVVKVTVTIAEV